MNPLLSQAIVSFTALCLKGLKPLVAEEKQKNAALKLPSLGTLSSSLKLTKILNGSATISSRKGNHPLDRRPLEASRIPRDDKTQRRQNKIPRLSLIGIEQKYSRYRIKAMLSDEGIHEQPFSIASKTFQEKYSFEISLSTLLELHQKHSQSCSIARLKELNPEIIEMLKMKPKPPRIRATVHLEVLQIEVLENYGIYIAKETIKEIQTSREEPPATAVTQKLSADAIISSLLGPGIILDIQTSHEENPVDEAAAEIDPEIIKEKPAKNVTQKLTADAILDSLLR